MLSSVIYDQLYSLTILSLPMFNEFFKHFCTTIEFHNFLESHPEYYLIFKDYVINYYYFYFSNIYLSLYLMNISESFITPVMMIPQFIFIFLSVLLLLLTYFNYTNTISLEDNLVDDDYLVVNITIEAEEEIGSMDDMLLASVILLYIFL
jgi:hypothetical protein